MDISSFEIRPIVKGEWEDALQLAWDTFLVFEAPEYGRDGIGSFRRFLRDPMLKNMFVMGEYLVYGAFLRASGEIVGVLGTRSYKHVSILFVHAEYHLQGIGSSLIRRFFVDARKHGSRRITVHSAPYAREFYHKLGFKDIDKEIISEGIRYTPMEIEFKYG